MSDFSEQLATICSQLTMEAHETVTNCHQLKIVAAAFERG